MRANKQVQVWLFIGLFMVFIQILVGGITRLTESGLSITKWEVVSGTFPPMTDKSWTEEFNKYKETPQYKEINEGMDLAQFKFIYFWEYIHRLWARFMGFVFLIPFLYFVYKGWIDKKLYKDLSIVILLASLAAIFGWIMVASGLVQRPWVNAYKLSIHLLIACSVFGYLLWTFLKVYYSYPANENREKYGSGPRWVTTFLFVFILQLILGGMMSGMKIAVVYPSWPYMNGEFIPTVLMDGSQWSLKNLTHYDSNEFAPAFTHFFHRLIAYMLCIVYSILFFKFYQSDLQSIKHVLINKVIVVLGFVLLLQVILGISTVMNSQGKVPVSLGVAHQAGAVLVLATIIYFIFVVKKKVD